MESWWREWEWGQGPALNREVSASALCPQQPWSHRPGSGSQGEKLLPGLPGKDRERPPDSRPRSAREHWLDWSEATPPPGPQGPAAGCRVSVPGRGRTPPQIPAGWLGLARHCGSSPEGQSRARSAMPGGRLRRGLLGISVGDSALEVAEGSTLEVGSGGAQVRKRLSGAARNWDGPVGLSLWVSG